MHSKKAQGMKSPVAGGRRPWSCRCRDAGRTRGWVEVDPLVSMFICQSVSFIGSWWVFGSVTESLKPILLAYPVVWFHPLMQRQWSEHLPQ